MTDRGTDETEWAMTIRPYTLTGGRTHSSVMTIEAMITIDESNAELPENLVPELYAIMDLARQPLSIAEVSAHLGLPLQVAKVLVGDLVDAGHLHLQTSGGVEIGHRPDLELLDRVLEGLLDL